MANDFSRLDENGLLFLLQLLISDIKAATPDLSSYVQTDDSRLTDDRKPTAHTSATTEFGGATASLFGHIKLSDTIDTVVGASADSVGASQKAVNDVYKAIPALDTAITSAATEDKAASSKAVYDYVSAAMNGIEHVTIDTNISETSMVTNAASSKAVYDFVTNALADITHFSAQIVEALPETGETNIMYLIAKDPTGESGNVYDEYLYINGKFELIGTTAMDLSDYVLASEMRALTNSEISDIYANAKAAVNG